MTEVLQKGCSKCGNRLEELKWNVEESLEGTGGHVNLNSAKLFLVSGLIQK